MLASLFLFRSVRGSVLTFILHSFGHVLVVCYKLEAAGQLVMDSFEFNIELLLASATR